MSIANNGWLVVTNITGTGAAADVLQVRGVRPGLPLKATLYITGTFSGTIAVQVSTPGAANYATISSNVVTTPTAVNLDINTDCDVILNCTAFTSGTGAATLVVGI